MSGPRRPGEPWDPTAEPGGEFAEEDTDPGTEDLGGDDLDYRRVGRPKLPPELKRRAKLRVALTGDEMTSLIVAAAETKDHKGRPLRVQDWARRVLLEAARKAKS